MSITYSDASKRMSQITVHNGTVYLAGQVPHDTGADMHGQTREVLETIDGLLRRAGSAKDHLLSATIWITNMAEFDAMNAAWDTWIAPGRPPVRACVEARLAKPEWKVEIMVVAALVES